LGTYHNDDNREVNLGIDFSTDLFLKGADIYDGVQKFVEKYYEYIRDMVESKLLV
jgi:hypothetical protein